MKKITYVTKTGKKCQGLYTTSCMPNQSKKRIRKKDKISENYDNYNIKYNINIFKIIEIIFARKFMLIIFL